MAHKLEIFRKTTAVIHLDNLASNYLALKSLVGDKTFFCPMVKANAYGHGDVEIALKLESLGVRTLGVGLVEEGLLLRRMGVKCDLLVFGIFDGAAADEVVRWKLTPVVSVWEELEALQKVPASAGQKMNIHLKFDTGMHRLGFSIHDAQNLFNQLHNHPRFEVKGICTHLYKAEDANQADGESQQQLRKFQEVERIFSPLRPIGHTLNSAGLLNFHRLRENKTQMPSGVSLEQGVRPGLLIYGVNPLNYLPAGMTLKPVMSLRSHVVRFHDVQENDVVSYGGTWKAPRDSVVGVIPIGYADGYHRLLSNRADVLVKGQRVPQVGTVCMDYIMVDLTGVVTNAEINNHADIEATLFGYDATGHLLGAEELAHKAQTIPYEILTSVGERVPRVVETDQAAILRTGKDIRP